MVASREGPPAGLPEVPGYRVLSLIAQGGMGDVLLAEPTDVPGPSVALKVLRSDVVMDPQVLQRFRREGRVAAVLDHPHILRVREVRSWEGGSALVMDHVDGRPLGSAMLRRPDSDSDIATHGDATSYALDEMLEMLARIADALQHAHRQGVIHRDVKPGNILVRRDGHPFLLDFGLARQLESESALTTSRVVMGTPRYMSPEQILSRWDQVGPASDIYSLGATLYHVLAGSPPFNAATLDDLQAQIVWRDPPPLCRREPWIPRALEAVVERALSKHPHDRHPDAAAFADDLRKIVAGRAPQRSPAALARRKLRRLVGERVRRVAVPAIAVALVLLTLLGYRAWSSGRDERDALHRSHLLTAQLAIDSGDIDGATDAVSAADVLRPDDPLAQLLLASALTEFGRFDEADAAITRAREAGFDPERRETALDSLCAALYGFHRGTDEAVVIELAEDAARRDPALDPAWFLAYRIRRGVFDVHGARADLAEFRHRLPGDHRLAPLVDALLLELDGHPVDALAALDRLAAEPSRSRDLLLDREQGRIHLALALTTSSADVESHLDAAQEHLERAAARYPSDPWPSLNLAGVHLVRSLRSVDPTRELAAAEAACRNVLASGRVDISRTYAFAQIAEIARRRARDAVYGPDAEATREAFEQAVRTLRDIDPDARALPALASQLATLSAESIAATGDHAAAVTTFREAVEIDPDNVEARVRLGQELYLTESFAAARDEFTVAAERVDALDHAASEGGRYVVPLGTPDPRWLVSCHVWAFGTCAVLDDEVGGRTSRARLEEMIAGGAEMPPEELLTWIEFLATSACEALRDCASALQLLAEHEQSALDSLDEGSRDQAREMLLRVRLACP